MTCQPSEAAKTPVVVAAASDDTQLSFASTHGDRAIDAQTAYFLITRWDSESHAHGAALLRAHAPDEPSPQHSAPRSEKVHYEKADPHVRGQRERAVTR